MASLSFAEEIAARTLAYRSRLYASSLVVRKLVDNDRLRRTPMRWYVAEMTADELGSETWARFDGDPTAGRRLRTRTRVGVVSVRGAFFERAWQWQPDKVDTLRGGQTTPKLEVFRDNQPADESAALTDWRLAVVQAVGNAVLVGEMPAYKKPLLPADLRYGFLAGPLPAVTAPALWSPKTGAIEIPGHSFTAAPQITLLDPKTDSDVIVF